MYKVKRFSLIQKEFGNKENRAKKKAWELAQAEKIEVNPYNLSDQSKGIKYMLLDDTNKKVRLEDDFATMYKDKVKLAKLREANQKSDPLMEKMKLKRSKPELFESNRQIDKVKLALGKNANRIEEGSKNLDKLYEEVNNLQSKLAEPKATEEVVNKSKDKVNKVGKGLSKNAKIGLGIAAGTAVVGGTAYGIHKYKKNKKKRESII